ncbi:hypothetical protein [Bacteroides acidifaciens]|uniref:hypothetical protein n=2 Tax=Bacteroides acidifaciens TaxID=85831 RepID=UPI00258C149F|nr:hypothetical protein [Bacteroides acidifaciens]
MNHVSNLVIILHKKRKKNPNKNKKERAMSLQYDLKEAPDVRKTGEQQPLYPLIVTNACGVSTNTSHSIPASHAKTTTA